MSLTRLVATIAIVVTSAVAPVHGEEIKIEGGGAAVSSVFEPRHAAYEEETGVNLTIASSSPGRALIALEEGKVDVATGAVPFEFMVTEAAKLGVNINPASMRTTTFSINKTFVFLNKNNPAGSLSKEQLKGIFTGKITNWKEVGGSDMPIQVVWGKRTPGQNALFKKLILDGERVTKNATRVPTYDNIRDIILKNQGAIGIDPEGFISSGMRIADTPPVSHPVLAVTKGAPSPKVQRLFQFIRMTEFE